MQRYKFQALVTLGPAGKDSAATMPPGQMRRMVVRGEHHQTHGSHIFSALVTNNGDASAWLGEDHVIVTVVLIGDEPRECFAVGDPFALWRGGEIGHGVVTRRLFV